ncbi:MAG: hypothetical protein M3Y77_13770, partial [Actinomycetota bacterium]|nr:hypothetical protein [Actinomycetota bacterium]
MAHPVKHTWRNRPFILATVAIIALALAAPTLAPTASAATPSAATPSATAPKVAATPRAPATPRPASTPADPAKHQSRPGPKGPIGWDTYRHLDQVDAITTGVQTQQFSS